MLDIEVSVELETGTSDVDVTEVGSTSRMDSDVAESTIEGLDGSCELETSVGTDAEEIGISEEAEIEETDMEESEIEETEIEETDNEELEGSSELDTSEELVVSEEVVASEELTVSAELVVSSELDDSTELDVSGVLDPSSELDESTELGTSEELDVASELGKELSDSEDSPPFKSTSVSDGSVASDEVVVVSTLVELTDSVAEVLEELFDEMLEVGMLEKS